MIPEGQGEPPFRDHLFPDTHRHSTEVAAITAIRFAHNWLGRLTAFVAGSILAVTPAEMIARQPYLARWMAGGEGNPLGARAIYLGSTVYRIHGTNMPSTIGERVSSGCISMLNEDVIDLCARIDVGTKIIVLPSANFVATISSTPLRTTSIY